MVAVIVGPRAASAPVAWAVLAFLLPVNLIFYAIENLLFLWYPSRVVAGQFDVMAIGRQMLFLLAKVARPGAWASGLAALVGRRRLLRWPAGVPAGAGRGLGGHGRPAPWRLVPLVGRAFARFDVTRDIPA